MNEKMSKRRIQIRDLQKQEIEEKQERRLLIRQRMDLRRFQEYCYYIWKVRTQDSEKFVEEVKSLVTAWLFLALQLKA